MLLVLMIMLMCVIFFGLVFWFFMFVECGYTDFREASGEIYEKVVRYYEEYPEVREYVDKLPNDKITKHNYAVILGIVVKSRKLDRENKDDEKKVIAKIKLKEAIKRNHM